MSDYFIPVGGANEIGASAYFLSIDGLNILLDCGARLKGEELYPDYERLLREITDFSKIDLIFISHGHYDHIGSFARIASLAKHAEIITTKDTRSLIYLQLLEFGRISGRVESQRVKNERYRQAQAAMERIHVRPVMKTFEVKGCKVTFIPAGHMIGAVMIYIETPSHKILYSGDFSSKTMFGLNGMKISSEIQPDILLLNAPNVYLTSAEWSEQYRAETYLPYEADHYSKLEDIIRERLSKHRKVYLTSRSVPKHMDLFYFLESAFADVPVYLEPRSKQVADALSDMGYSIYRENIHVLNTEPQEDCIVVGQEAGKRGYSIVTFDGYSLHASPVETLELVKELYPKEVYLLHVYPDQKKKSLKGMLANELPNTSMIQAMNGTKYYLKRERKMKHSQIYQELLKKELETAQKKAKENTPNNEWIGIYGSLKYPDVHPRVAYRSLVKEFVNESQFSYDDYLKVLHSANLDGEEKRKYIANHIEHGVTLLKQALDGDRKAVEQYSEFTENLEQRDKNRRAYMIGKYMVVFMFLIDPDLKSSEYKLIATTFRSRYCNHLIREIRNRLLEEYNIVRRKRSAREVLQMTEAVITESSKVTESTAPRTELEQLRFENDNYKNSLELVQAMLDELNETIDETAAEAKNTEIVSFYSKMNSDDYGNLLDSIELVERRLAALKENKVRVMPQLLPLTIVFKQLLRFIKECGVTAIDKTGREFETEVEGLAEYTYNGEAYSYPGEKKRVVVEKPGWKYGSTVISLPTVREKEDEEG